MKQIIKDDRSHHPNWRWLILTGGLLLQTMIIVLVNTVQPVPTAMLQEILVDRIMAIIISCAFCLIGIVIFLRIKELLTACMAYGVFVCGSLVFGLLNISSYRESGIAMSMLSVIAYGLAATFVCQFAFPVGWSARKWRISLYVPLVLSIVLCIIELLESLLFPSQWPAIALLIYVFPFACMGIITWGIFSGLHQAAENNRPLDGMASIGMVFVLLSLSIIDAKSTPYHITYLPTTVNFIVFYAFFVDFIAICASIIFWAWNNTMMHLWRIILPLVGIGVLLWLAQEILQFPTSNLTFWLSALRNLFVYHLPLVPMMVLPVIVCYALIYHQLASQVGLLSRHFIRGTLWFILASCFVISEIIGSVQAVQSWNDHSEITLVCVCWLFLSCWLFPLLWSKIRDVGDRMFYRDFYSYNRTLRDLSLALTRLRDLNQICAFLLPRLTKLLNAQGATLLIWKEASEPAQHWQCYYYQAISGDTEAEQCKIAAQQAISHFVMYNDTPQLIDDILLLPLHDDRSLRGCLCLGKKFNREPYSRQDKSFLETLVAQLAVLEASTRYLDQVHAHTLQVTALNHRIIQAQEEERHRLALELHDDVLQQAMLLTRQLTDLDDDPRIAKALPLARSITNGLRTSCLQLRPPLLDELGLPEALRWLAQQTEQQSGIRILYQFLSVSDTLFSRPLPAVELALYRMAQEALTNAIKHAEASLIRMRLRTNREGAVTLLIADNGRGLQRSRPLTGSLGLAGIAERLQSIGSKLYLRSSHGHGVVIGALYHPPIYSEHRSENRG